MLIIQLRFFSWNRLDSNNIKKISNFQGFIYLFKPILKLKHDIWNPGPVIPNDYIPFNLSFSVPEC